MRLKKLLRELITISAERAKAAGRLAYDTLPAFDLEAPKQAEHGDLATNLATLLASQARRPQRQVAEIIIDGLLPPEGLLRQTEVAGARVLHFFFDGFFLS